MKSLLRPSSLNIISRCPGSVRTCKQLELEYPSEEKEETEDEEETKPETVTSRGKRLHALCSSGILNPKQRTELLAECADEVEHVFLTACWTEAEQCWSEIPSHQRKIAKVMVEKTVNLESIGLTEGTPDFAIFIPATETEDGIIIVRDWKSGAGYVTPAKHNPQLLSYASGIASGSRCRPDIGICQPAASEYIDKWIGTPGDLDLAADRIRRSIERTDDPNSALNPGGWCRYCPANTRCPARSLAVAEVKSIQGPVETIRTLEGQARTELYEKLVMASKVLEKARETVEEEIRSGTLEIPGYCLGPGKKGRFWSMEDTAVIERLTALCIEKNDPALVFSPITVSQAEKRFGTEAIADMIGEKLGKPSIRKAKA